MSDQAVDDACWQDWRCGAGTAPFFLVSFIAVLCLTRPNLGSVIMLSTIGAIEFVFLLAAVIIMIRIIATSTSPEVRRRVIFRVSNIFAFLSAGLGLAAAILFEVLYPCNDLDSCVTGDVHWFLFMTASVTLGGVLVASIIGLVILSTNKMRGLRVFGVASVFLSVLLFIFLPAAFSIAVSIPFVGYNERTLQSPVSLPNIRLPLTVLAELAYCMVPAVMMVRPLCSMTSSLFLMHATTVK
jgi:hypothetical protein